MQVSMHMQAHILTHTLSLLVKIKLSKPAFKQELISGPV